MNHAVELRLLDWAITPYAIHNYSEKLNKGF